ncbi:copper transport protein ATOX1 isoform X1 [Anser cygnoides]|uniref:copper transport protein ATOX1 isoform X1 n=1 Tax=Anser cygnoides TaxID=8845 RepID=UPI0034D30FE0
MRSPASCTGWEQESRIWPALTSCEDLSSCSPVLTEWEQLAVTKLKALGLLQDPVTRLCRFQFLCVQFDIDLPNKKVCIDSEHNVDTLLETLKKTGKSASYLGEKSAQ